MTDYKPGDAVLVPMTVKFYTATGHLALALRDFDSPSLYPHPSCVRPDDTIPDEPPVGSVVAVPGCLPLFRCSDGLWWNERQSSFAWPALWSSDLVILRNGWEGE
jgi:hypothetical protein